MGKTPDWKILEADDTLALFFKDTRVGNLLYSTTVNSKKKRIIVSSRVTISSGAQVPGTFSSMELHESREYDFTGMQTLACQKLTSPSGTSVWELRKARAGGWTLSVSAGGITRSLSFAKVQGNLNASYAIQSAILDRTIQKGDTWQDTVFDLTSTKHLAIRTECTMIPDKNRPYYGFKQRDDIMGREEHWEVDTIGRTVLQEVPPFFIARRLSEKSMHGDSASSASTPFETLMELFKVSSERPPKRSEATALTLSPEAKLHASVASLYTLRDSMYVLKPFPEKCKSRSNEKRVAYKKGWLRSTVTIQSDHKKIVALAKKLAGTEKDRCTIISKLTDYVYANIKKEHIATFSNAYETLKAGRGDCGEHAALLTALLRAVDIESNVVLGLVYIPSRKGYYYHAWVAAYADSLIFTDPALGAFPATSGYIPLVYDDDGTNIIHLASLVDRITITYIPR